MSDQDIPVLVFVLVLVSRGFTIEVLPVLLQRLQQYAGDYNSGDAMLLTTADSKVGSQSRSAVVY